MPIHQLTRASGAAVSPQPALERKIGPLQATAINMTQMCGIGPFITIPAMVATMGGPEAMFGWIVGAILALADGLIWAELGAAMPGAGGTYIYLREAFQYRTGRLMPFLFVWSAVLFIPLIMSTGIIGLVQYLGYLIPGVTSDSGNTALGKIIGVGIILVIMVALFRRIGQIGKLTTVLFVVMLVAVLSTIVAAFTHFSGAQAFAFTPGAFSFSGGTFWAGLGAGLIIAIYDYLGYNTTAYLGAEMRDPGRTIPRSIVFSILGIMSLYFLLQIGVLGSIPLEESKNATSVASAVLEQAWGSGTAQVITVLIVVTAFGSVFAGLLGGSRVPFEAARDKVFLPVFGELHPKLQSTHRRRARHGRDHHHRLAVHADHDHQRRGRDPGHHPVAGPGRRDRRAAPAPAESAPPVPPMAVPGAHDRRAGRAGSTSTCPRPGSRSACPLAGSSSACIAFLIYARAEHTWPFGPKEINEAFADGG